MDRAAGMSEVLCVYTQYLIVFESIFVCIDQVTSFKFSLFEFIENISFKYGYLFIVTNNLLFHTCQRTLTLFFLFFFFFPFLHVQVHAMQALCQQHPNIIFSFSFSFFLFFHVQVHAMQALCQQHPNIISLEGSFIEEDFLYIIMEYASGGDLAAFLRVLDYT